MTVNTVLLVSSKHSEENSFYWNNTLLIICFAFWAEEKFDLRTKLRGRIVKSAFFLSWGTLGQKVVPSDNLIVFWSFSHFGQKNAILGKLLAGKMSEVHSSSLCPRKTLSKNHFTWNFTTLLVLYALSRKNFVF